MPDITFQTASDQISMTVPAGTAVLDAAREAGIDLTPRCGGNGSCGLCVVRLAAGKPANTPEEKERAHLGSANFVVGERLGCQVKVGEEDLVVVRDS